MKIFITLIVAIGLLGAVGFVHAATVPRPKSGIEGTISSIGSSGFAMTTKDGKTIDVLCNPNTQFLMGGQKADPKDIKTGTHVGIQGGQNSATQYTANVVNILPTKGKK